MLFPLLFSLLVSLVSSLQSHIIPHPPDYGPNDFLFDYSLFTNQRRRANACIVILCRNKDLKDVLISLSTFEPRFNAKFQYPYIFINDVPFNDEFKSTVKKHISSGTEIYFEDIPHHHWSYPNHINQTLAAIWRKELAKRGVMYAELESYRHMCRWFSGFFFRHPFISKFDWYWRVEPGVEFYCDIDYDPFLFMQANGKKYAFNVVLKELAATVGSLWSTTIDYIRDRGLNPPLLKFFRDPKTLGYNLCHFWSNFEIARTDLWNSEGYLDYFDYLDKRGGFFYERWGDAPVHSIGLALFLNKSQVHFFKPIGYRHEDFAHCSNDTMELQKICKCPNDIKNFDFKDGGSCLKNWIEYEDEPFF